MTLGDLTYTYDAAGNRTKVGGSWARTGIPLAVASATVDAANRVRTFGTATLGYDANGNLSTVQAAACTAEDLAESNPSATPLYAELLEPSDKRRQHA